MKYGNTKYHTRFIQTIILCVGAFVIGSCHDSSKQEESLHDLFAQEKVVYCHLNALQDSIRQDWDNINMLLDKNLPAETPAEERANILKVRNANLIRMFESFEQVDDETKQALHNTEMNDQKVAQRMIALKKKAHDIESKRNLLLEELHRKKGDEIVIRYKTNLAQILKEPCD